MEFPHPTHVPSEPHRNPGRWLMRAAAATSAVVLTLGLAACGDSGGGSSEDKPESKSSAEFTPKLTMHNKKIRYGTKATVAVDAKEPKIQGVNPKIAAGYAKSFHDGLMEQVKRISKSVEDRHPDGSEEWCERGTAGKCVKRIPFKVHAAQIYRDYATVSYELRDISFEAGTNNWVKSLTVNLRTGKPARPSDFIDTSASGLADAIKDGSCLEQYHGNPASADGFDAFSPTDDGFLATWPTGAMNSAAGCGIGSVTLPWSDFGTDKPGASATGDGIEEPDATSQAADDHCVGNPDFPSGTGAGACSAHPNGAKHLKAPALIMSPSKNLWCSVSGSPAALDCSMVDPKARVDLEPTGKAFIPDRDDGPVSESPTVLKYGTIAVVGDYACSSAYAGLACWHTKSKHGLFLSVNKQIRW